MMKTGVSVGSVKNCKGREPVVDAAYSQNADFRIAKSVKLTDEFDNGSKHRLLRTRRLAWLFTRFRNYYHLAPWMH